MNTNIILAGQMRKELGDLKINIEGNEKRASGRVSMK
jgi:hypothetical protein